MTDPDKLLQFNGLDATTGAALFPPRDASSFATRLLMQASSSIDADHLRELQGRDSLSIKEGVDITDLAQTGWGVVFPAVRPNTPEAARQDQIAEALYPLFELRREQAGRIDERRFKIYRGSEGYRPDETKSGYLARIGAEPGYIDPDRVPYYLLIVASPEELPFAIQVQLDVHYSVGRLHFDDIAGFANYARTVLAAEAGPLRPRSLALVGVANPGDAVSTAAARDVVAPLAGPLATATAPDWQVFHYAGEHAQKASVARLLGGDATPALLLATGHGLGYPPGDPLQRRYQGGLVCQDWPGPSQPGRLNVASHCFTVDDIRPDADLSGLMYIDLTCFGAGTPVLADDGRQLTEVPFLSALHQALLGHPRGGAIATIGHLERAYGAAAHPDEARGHRMALDVAIRKLLAGYPVGAAMEEMNDRYATLALDLHAKLTALKSGKEIDPTELTDLWIATHDARGCAISGDPAVRIAAAPVRRVDPPTRRTVINPQDSSTAISVDASIAINIDIDDDDDGPPVLDDEGPTEPAAVIQQQISRTLIDPPREEPPRSGHTEMARTAAYPKEQLRAPRPASAGAQALSAKPADSVRTSKPAAPEPAPAPAKPAAPPSPTLAPRQVSHTVAPKPPQKLEAGLNNLFNLLSGKSTAAGAPELPTLEQLTHGLLQLLQRSLADVSDLEVRTYVARDLPSSAAADRQGLPATAELRAFTRVHLDGDIDVCVPETAAGEVDRELWQLHGEMVKQAQQNRAELLKMLLTTSAHILRGG